MKYPELVKYAEPILKLIAAKKMSFQDVMTETKLTEEQFCDILGYLKDRSVVSYIKTGRQGLSGILNFQVTEIGAEIAFGKRRLIQDSMVNQETFNITAVGNYADVSGSGNVVNQTTMFNISLVLKEIIENDKALNPQQKYKLLEILEKFNMIRESGENISKLLSEVTSVAGKYLPLFFTLASKLN